MNQHTEAAKVNQTFSTSVQETTTYSRITTIICSLHLRYPIPGALVEKYIGFPVNVRIIR